MEEKLIPAPIDGKNVAKDWIEEIFDFQTCVWGKKCAVGFINSEPVIACWDKNLLIWQFPITTHFENSLSLARLKDRLEKYSENNPELVEHYNVVGNMLMQKFYWKSEDFVCLEKHFEKAVQYVRENADWSKACEEYAKEIMEEKKCPLGCASLEISEKIVDLMDEYGVAYNLPDNWWEEFGYVDDVFMKL